MKALLLALGAALVGALLWIRIGASREDLASESIEAPRSELRREPVPVLSVATPADGSEGWVESNNRAVELAGEGRLDEAIALLEQCVDARPEELLFARNLARILARRATQERDRAGGDRGQVLADLERAVALDPEDAGLAALLDKWRQQELIEADHALFQSEHFEFSYPPHRSDLVGGVRDLVDALERAYSDLWLTTSHDPVLESRERLRVVLLGRDDFRTATGLGHWAGGAFDGTIRVGIDDLGRERDATVRTLRHELTHAFVQSLGGAGVPGWLNEGLAQWFEPAGESALQGARERLSGAVPFDLEDLSGSLASVGDSGAIARAYAQSLLMVDHIDRFFGERMLGELIAGCGEGRSPQQSFLDRTGRGLDSLLEDLADTLRRR
jgi:tetratricopeptide (TPR) repeat protein